jgi:flagellar biosynthesis protein FlhG
VRNGIEGREVFEHLNRVAERFLDVTLNYLGFVPHDEALRSAVKRQLAVVHCSPGSPASQAFADIARKVDEWDIPRVPRGGLEFFVDRMVGMPNLAAVG